MNKNYFFYLYLFFILFSKTLSFSIFQMYFSSMTNNKDDILANVHSKIIFQVRFSTITTNLIIKVNKLYIYIQCPKIKRHF